MPLAPPAVEVADASRLAAVQVAAVSFDRVVDAFLDIDDHLAHGHRVHMTGGRLDQWGDLAAVHLDRHDALDAAPGLHSAQPAAIGVPEQRVAEEFDVLVRHPARCAAGHVHRPQSHDRVAAVLGAHEGDRRSVGGERRPRGSGHRRGEPPSFGKRLRGTVEVQHPDIGAVALAFVLASPGVGQSPAVARPGEMPHVAIAAGERRRRLRLDVQQHDLQPGAQHITGAVHLVGQSPDHLRRRRGGDRALQVDLPRALDALVRIDVHRADQRELPAVRSPGQVDHGAGETRDLARLSAVRGHQVHLLRPAMPIAEESDAIAAGRPARSRVLARHEGQPVRWSTVQGQQPQVGLVVIVRALDRLHRAYRTLAARVQVERLDALLDEDAPTVLLGDFNEWRLHGCLAVIERRLVRVPAPPTFPSPCPVARLDRLFVSAGLRVSHVRTHRSRSAMVASDHLPLVATLERA